MIERCLCDNNGLTMENGEWVRSDDDNNNNNKNNNNNNNSGTLSTCEPHSLCTTGGKRPDGDTL